MLPLCFLAFFLGHNFTFDRLVTRPALQFFDSMSRIAYNINAFIAEVIGFTMIFFAAFTIARMKLAPEGTLFRQLLLLLTLDTVIVVFGIYPALLYFYAKIKNRTNGFCSYGSGSCRSGIRRQFLSLGLLVRHGKENTGLPRKIGSMSYPFLPFRKAGTAMVSSLAFLMILRSYSSLG